MNLGDLDANIYPRLIERFDDYINTGRGDLLRTIAAQRTRFVTVVLEDVYQSQNANAVIRTAECLGLQDLYIIEQNNHYTANPGVLQGADKWVDLVRYNTPSADNTSQCLQDLKQQGYRIIAMSLGDDSAPLQEFRLERKTALCFGTEETGLSETARQMADQAVKIPLAGFTRSYNLSVSAGISLYFLLEQLRDSDIDWCLSTTEQDELLVRWLAQSTPSGESLLQRFIGEMCDA